MPICRDIQTKYDLLTVRPEILIVAMLELARFRIGSVVFTNERHSCAVIVKKYPKDTWQRSGSA